MLSYINTIATISLAHTYITCLSQVHYKQYSVTVEQGNRTAYLHITHAATNKRFSAELRTNHTTLYRLSILARQLNNTVDGFCREVIRIMSCLDGGCRKSRHISHAYACVVCNAALKKNCLSIHTFTMNSQLIFTYKGKAKLHNHLSTSTTALFI